MSDRLTPAQIRGARRLLDWSMNELADAAQLSISTIKRGETTEFQQVSDDVHRMVQNALQTAGIRFLDDDGDGIGIRLQTSSFDPR